IRRGSGNDCPDTDWRQYVGDQLYGVALRGYIADVCGGEKWAERAVRGCVEHDSACYTSAGGLLAAERAELSRRRSVEITGDYTVRAARRVCGRRILLQRRAPLAYS